VKALVLAIILAGCSTTPDKTVARHTKDAEAAKMAWAVSVHTNPAVDGIFTAAVSDFELAKLQAAIAVQRYKSGLISSNELHDRMMFLGQQKDRLTALGKNKP
jgi:PBP1b-binding outer membrane lipoprotein LpoB